MLDGERLAGFVPKAALRVFVVPIDGLTGQQGAAGQVIRIHHGGDALQRGHEEGLFPILEAVEAIDEIRLQQAGFAVQNRLGLFRSLDIDFPLVTLPPDAGDESLLLAYLFGLKTLLLLLFPFVPHLAEELWHGAGFEGFMLLHPWPSWIDRYAERDVVTIVVQVNGKLRSRFEAPRDTAEDALRKTALEDEHIRGHIEGMRVVKTIVIPNKLVNLVVQ